MSPTTTVLCLDAGAPAVTTYDLGHLRLTEPSNSKSPRSSVFRQIWRIGGPQASLGRTPVDRRVGEVCRLEVGRQYHVGRSRERTHAVIDVEIAEGHVLLVSLRCGSQGWKFGVLGVRPTTDNQGRVDERSGLVLHEVIG